LEPVRHFASIKAIPNDSICRRDDVSRFAIDSPVSVAPCGAREVSHSTRNCLPAEHSRSTSETRHRRALSWSVEIDRGHPHQIDDSCRRVDLFITKLDSVRAPIVSWMINEKPTSYVRSRGSFFSISTLFSQQRESRIGKASIQTDRLAEFTYRFIIPIHQSIRFDGPLIVEPRTAFDRRIAPYLRTTIFPQSVPATCSKSSTSRSRIALNPHILVSHAALPVSFL
jgi:hypothetical protein